MLVIGVEDANPNKTSNGPGDVMLKRESQPFASYWHEELEALVQRV
jgi:hypothetical protein